MDEYKQVAARAVTLAEAAQIPLGIPSLGSAFAGKETAYQDRARRLRPSSRRLPSAVNREHFTIRRPTIQPRRMLICQRW